MINILHKVFKTIHQRITSKIRFVIVDYDEHANRVTFLCYGGRAFFKKSLLEAIVDDDLMLGLTSEQACYLGIRMGQLIKSDQNCINTKQYEKMNKIGQKNSTQSKDSITFDRKGNLIYVDRNSNVKIKNAYVIASTRELIMQFNPILACRIGIHVGSTQMNVKDSIPKNILLFRNSSRI